MSENDDWLYINRVSKKVLNTILDPQQNTPPYTAYKIEENPDGQPTDIGPMIFTAFDANLLTYFVSLGTDADFISHGYDVKEYMWKSLGLYIPKKVDEIASAVRERLKVPESFTKEENEALRMNLYLLEMPFAVLAFAEHPSEREVPILSFPFFISPIVALESIQENAKIRLRELGEEVD